MTRLILATRNAGKITELRTILADAGLPHPKPSGSAPSPATARHPRRQGNEASPSPRTRC
ncbi:hypothetical protein ACRAWF_10155 [Streptomyces sp. L7]